ncbi:hypothetical protein EDB80DRAFT_710877 [Ilyonectria destructans]|nr:hypothetical protein EDB80DRAFT_710877 [Ilyonectria destructans]
MAVKQSGGSTKRDNVPARYSSRHARARLQAYFEALATNAEHWEGHSTEIDEELQLEAYNALIENLYMRRVLANHHGITEEEFDRLVEDDHMAAEAETAIAPQVSVNYAGIAPSAPDSPLQPLSRPPTTPFPGPINPTRRVPVVPNDIPRITEPPHLLGALNSSLSLSPITKKNVPRPQPPILPPLYALRLPDPYVNYIDSLPALPSASMQDSRDGTHHLNPYGAQSFQVPVGSNTIHRPEGATRVSTRKSSIFHLIH